MQESTGEEMSHTKAHKKRTRHIAKKSQIKSFNSANGIRLSGI